MVFFIQCLKDKYEKLIDDLENEGNRAILKTDKVEIGFAKLKMSMWYL